MGEATSLLDFVGPADLRHDPGRGPRAGHRDADRAGDRAVHLALRAAPARVGPRLPGRPARRHPVGRLRPLGRPGARADGQAGLGVAQRVPRLHPVLRRHRVADRPRAHDRGPGPRGDDPADHHRREPRGVPADAAPARGGGPRPGGHALGDDPDRGPAVRALGHRLRRDARPRPRARRDDGGPDDPVARASSTRSSCSRPGSSRRSRPTSPPSSPRRTRSGSRR